MTHHLDYARPTIRRPSRLLAVFAHLTLAYPLFLLGALYGEWFIAWYMLGHEPRPSLDDPKYIGGSSWMHPIVGAAIIGLATAALAALVLNALYVFDSRVRGGRLAIRVVCLLALWLGMIALLRFDPHRVLNWWFD